MVITSGQSNSSLWNDSLLYISFAVPVVLQPKIAVFPLRKAYAKQIKLTSKISQQLVTKKIP